MPIIFGLTPKVSRLHFDDILSQFTLRITWQLSTPFGVFPQREEFLTFADLASALNAIKAIWGTVASTDDATTKYIFAPLGDFAPLTTVPDGKEERTYVAAPPPPFDMPDVEAPDVVPDYDGESDDWGQTLGP